MEMLTAALQSGSSGNCYYVEADGVGLLVDAGISGIQADIRLKAFGRDIRKASALIISHDHGDHCRYAGVFQRKYGLPVYITSATLRAAIRNHPLGELKDVRHFKPGDSLSFGPLRVHTFPTPHDGAEGSVFVASGGGKSVGVLTDLGHVFEGLGDIVSDLDAVFIESNYDPGMLEHGPYPAFLKRRIQGPSGHISNEECAGLLRHASRGRLKWACLSHLSENNNDPLLALRTHRNITGTRHKFFVAGRYSSTGPLKV